MKWHENLGWVSERSVMISLLPCLHLWRQVRDYEVKKEFTLSRDFGVLVEICWTYGMFKPHFLDFGCGGYISLQVDQSQKVCDKYQLGVFEVCQANLCDCFTPSKLESFVCLPPTSNSKFNKTYYTPPSHHLRYLGGWVVIVEYQLQCQICVVANHLVLHDAQYIALLYWHLLGWKREGKYSPALLKDEKKNKREDAGPYRRRQPGQYYPPSNRLRSHGITGCSGQMRNGTFVHFIPTLIITGQLRCKHSVMRYYEWFCPQAEQLIRQDIAGGDLQSNVE